MTDMESPTRSSFTSLLDRIRKTPAINVPATVLARQFIPQGVLRHWFVKHLPRHGKVSIRLPHDTSRRQVIMLSGSDWITSRLWWDGGLGFEPEVGKYFASLAKRARCILDIGAFSGWYTLWSSVISPSAKVFALEPHPEVADLLQRNLALNNVHNVTYFPYAAAETDGFADFHIGAPGLPSSSSLESAWKGLDRTITVATRSIDSLMASQGYPNVDLVKIDIEGSERLALKGMTQTLLRCYPAIIVEVLPAYRAQFLEVLELLTEIGYAFFECTPESLLPIDASGDGLLTADSVNFLALHKTQPHISNFRLPST
jgi:FkbM family methyltransferase